MEKLNRKGFFATLFGGIAGVVAGSSVKASEPITPETVVYCDKLVFTHSSGASCVMSFIDSDNFTIKVNNSENISINIHSPLKKPDFVKTETDYGFYGNNGNNGNNGNAQMTITSNGNLGLGTCNPTAKLDIRG